VYAPPVAGQNEGRLRAVYDALNDRDLVAAVEYTHPDVVAHSLVMEAEGTAYHGHGGMRRLMEDLFEVFPDWRGEVGHVEETADRILAGVRVSGHAAASGVSVDQRTWLVARIEDGLIIELRFFRTEDEARAAS
jgi:ketosteroid isomerase-like protein